MMSFAKNLSLHFVLLAIALLASGCGSRADGDPEAAFRKAELGEIHEMYTMYVKQHQQPPRQLRDLEGSREIYPRGYKALQEGRYIAVWGVSGKDSSTVLAYARDAFSQGGSVILANGTIKTMTADELRTALKGKG